MDTLDRIRAELQDRVAELEPLRREYERLKAAHAALEAASPRPARRSGDPAAREAPAVGRRRGSARDLILAAARENPDAKRGDIARLTGLAPNTVGSTLAKLRAEGLLPRPVRRERALESHETSGAADVAAAEPLEDADATGAEPDAAQQSGDEAGHAQSAEGDAADEPVSASEEPAKRRSRRRSTPTERSTSNG